VTTTVSGRWHRRSQGECRGCRCIPLGDEKIFLGFFVEMRQKWAEFGEVNPRLRDIKYLVAVFDAYEHVREGDD